MIKHTTAAACLTACQHDEEEDAVGKLQPVNVMKKRNTGLSRERQKQGRRVKGTHWHLHSASDVLQPADMMKKRRTEHNRQ